jgi:4-phosphopantoate--beta-alanine ligase
MKNSAIPPDHPRRVSLEIRERVIEGHDKHIVATAGLLAHGRGEAFDYMIGEKTTDQARQSARAAVAALLEANHPVISVNGNACALAAKELTVLSEVLNAPLEINLFYYTREREDAILKALKKAGAKKVLGTHDRPSSSIPELSSNRRKVDSEGIAIADAVLVPLEDGDRTEALRALGKMVIAIDLNPMSRTARHANITIVDNIVRILPLMIDYAREMRDLSKERLDSIVSEFDNGNNLTNCIRSIMSHLESEARDWKAADVLVQKGGITR